VNQWPSYLAYATSFLTIGGMWMAHDGIFRRLASADGMVMRLNILLLMLISFLPLPTKLVGKAIHKAASAERAAVIFYGLVLLARPRSVGDLGGDQRALALRGRAPRSA
jgi:uncharacterized membrane protein